MLIEESFEVDAAPDAVYAYLLQADKVVTCMPGAELLETIDEDNLNARVKIKVGAIVARYEGKVQIVEREPTARRATLRADGRELGGSGHARASITMLVEQTGTGSSVVITTDYSVVGRVAQFGRGVMEEVSRRLLAEMAACIRSRLEPTAATES